jgi:hypothetical protein
MNGLITSFDFYICFLYSFLIRPIGIKVESWNRPLDSITVTQRYRPDDGIYAETCSLTNVKNKLLSTSSM